MRRQLISKNSSGEKIAIVGVVSPGALGDAIQQYVAVKLVRSFLSDADISFISPYLREQITSFRHLKLDARLISAGFTPPFLVKYLLDYKCKYLTKKYLSKGQREKSHDNILKTLSLLLGVGSFSLVDLYVFGKMVGCSIAMSQFSFDAAILAGHTICTKPYGFILQYDGLRSVVRGPLVASPISISSLPFRSNDKTLLKRVKQSLKKFTFLYVRGPISLRFLTEQLNVREEKVAMALDSGFGIRLIHPRMVSSRLQSRALRLVIIPRKDYFAFYQRWDLYKPYLDALVGLILWLIARYDVEVYLASQVVDESHISSIDDIVKLVERRTRNNGQFLKCLKIFRPESIVDAYRLYSSADFVISSFMHGGVMALSAGIPALFISPSADVKVPDVLSFLGLDLGSFLIDMFDPNALKVENLIYRIGKIIQNLEYYGRTVESAVSRALPTVELPARTLARLLE